MTSPYRWLLCRPLRAWLSPRAARRLRCRPAPARRVRLEFAPLEDRVVPDARPLPLPVVFAAGGPGRPA